MNTKPVTIHIPVWEKNFSEISKKRLKTLAIGLVAISLMFGGIWAYGGFRALDYALTHENLSRNQVKYPTFQLDLDDFRPTYEVEWYREGREQEFTLHAITGEMLEFDR